MESIPQNTPALAETLALLAQTPSALNALLRPLSSTWTDQNEGEATWTPKEVVAHLLGNEHANWLPRARFLLASNEVQAFPAIVRSPGSEEDKSKSLPQLLDAFAQIRAANIAEVASWQLTSSDLERQAIHPAFGPVTLGQLLATWSTHDLTHLHQITRTLAHQQRHAVGPWIKYLGVLHCTGHGE